MIAPRAGWVCEAFETDRRRSVLSFSHHIEVAKLEKKEADALFTGLKIVVSLGR